MVVDGSSSEVDAMIATATGWFRSGRALAMASAVACAATLSAQEPGEPAERKTSKEPPPGAPWVREFQEAREKALRSGKPIFLYSTKTH